MRVERRVKRGRVGRGGPMSVIARGVRDELLRALERRDETVLAIAGLS